MEHYLDETRDAAAIEAKLEVERREEENGPQAGRSARLEDNIAHLLPADTNSDLCLSR